MPIQPLQATLELLGRDSRVGRNATDTVSYLMDLLYYGEFQIFEQVTSGYGFERVNLVGTKGNGGDAPLWLVGTMHTSTDPQPNHWASVDSDGLGGRYRPRSRLVHGLGAVSGKIDLALKILAASRFPRDVLKRPITIAALSGEEAHGSGIHALMASGPSPGGVALVGAPTNLELWRDHPGCVVLSLRVDRKLRHRRMPPCRGFFEVHIHGKSAHALTGLGDNALTRGLALIDTLGSSGDMRLLELRAGEAANRVPGSCTLRVATSFETPPEIPGATIRPIADGTALPFPVDGLLTAWRRASAAGIEAVSDHVGAKRNRRAARPTRDHWVGKLETDRNAIEGTIMWWTGPGVDTKALCERFAEAVQRALTGEDEMEVAIDVIQDRAAFAASEGGDGWLAATKGAMRDAGLPPATTGGVLTTDAAQLRVAGVDTLVFGPGRGVGDLYRDDEAIPLQHIEAAYRFYEALIERWCVKT